MRLLMTSFTLAALTACGGSKTPPASSPEATTIALHEDAATKPEPAPAPGPDAAAAASPDAAVAPPDAAAKTPDPATSDAAAPTPDPSTPDTGAATPAPTPAPAPAAGAEVDAAKELVASWVKAQNDGDFDAYAKHYAPRFTGIKRAGPRMRKYGHDGWLDDRKRMFKSTMTVSADEVAVAPSQRSTIVTFVQSWASGDFADKGPKQLVLVPTAGGLRIAREEMMASEIAAAAEEGKALAAEDFMFVIDGKSGVSGGVAVVFPIDVIAPDLGVGEAQLVQRTGPTIVKQAVDAAKLPDAAKAWVGRKVAVYGADGAKCEGTLERFELLGRMVPHFGTVQFWDGVEGMGERKLSDAEVAKDAWAGSLIGVELVGRVPACETGAFARDAARPAPGLFASAPVDAGLRDKAMAAAKALSGWKAVTAMAKEYPEVKPESWETYDGAAPVVAAFKDAGGRTFVQVEAAAGYGCGMFGASFTALFELKGDGLVLLSSPEGGPTGTVRAVVDLDGDGDVEMLLDHGLIQKAGPTWRQTRDVAPPDYDCPC